MPCTVAVLNQKGGAGKTTTTTSLAIGLISLGYSVLVVDSDPQGSIRDWHAANEDNQVPVVGLDRPSLAKDIKAVSSGYDYVLIDGAPQIERMQIAAVKAADLVVIPVQPSPYDVWACDSLVEIIKGRQELTDGQPNAVFFVSRAIKNTKLSGEIRGALDSFGFPVLESMSFQRVIYQDAPSLGLTPLEVEPKGEAAQEILALTNEIVSLTRKEKLHGVAS